MEKVDFKKQLKALYQPSAKTFAIVDVPKMQFFKEIELPDFVKRSESVVVVKQIYPAGWWDELTVTFVFKRRYGWYVLQVRVLRASLE